MVRIKESKCALFSARLQLINGKRKKRAKVELSRLQPKGKEVSIVNSSLIRLVTQAKGRKEASVPYKKRVKGKKETEKTKATLQQEEAENEDEDEEIEREKEKERAKERKKQANDSTFGSLAMEQMKESTWLAKLSEM